MRRLLSRRLGSLVLLLAIGAIAPTTAMGAAESPNACSLYGATVGFTMPLPSSIRSVGTHGYEFYGTWDGGSYLMPWSIAVVAGTPLYSGTVYLRPFYAIGQRADGSIDGDVAAIDPSQTARFGVNWGVDRGVDQAFADSIQTSVRWETSPGVWSDWVAMPKGPVTSICAPGGANHYGGYFREAWGWGG